MKYNQLKGFPLKPHTKLPAIREWQAQAHYQRLWEIRKVNKGVICGKENRLLVVDCDVKGKANGVQSFVNIMKDFDYEHLPDTLTIATPSGGVHYYFTLPDDALDLRKQPRDDLGIDFQMNGAYVVAVGSKLETGEYTVVSNRPIAQAPRELIDWLIENAKQSDYTNTSPSELNRSLNAWFNMLAYESGLMGNEPWRLNSWVYKWKKLTNLDVSTIIESVKIIFKYLYGFEPPVELQPNKARGKEHSNALSRFLESLVYTRIDEGGRNNALAQTAGMLALGTNKLDLYKWACRLYMVTCFSEPLEDTEFELTVMSIWKREKGR